VNGATDAVTVVWVAPAEGRDDAVRALAEWGRARGLVMEAAGDVTVRPGPKIDLGIAERVEKEIDRAKEAIAAIDADAAERALARAEALLRDHPELPAAAWLRAEVDRTWAARFSRVEPKDEARARAAWQDADAIDGGRVPGIGETAFPRRANASAKLVVHASATARVIVYLDGTPLAPKSTADTSATYAFETPAAEHQIVATIDGEIAFASWVALAAGTTPSAPSVIDVSLGAGGTCDASSFASVARDQDRIRAPGVGCARWVAAIPGDKRGSVMVARCEQDACGPLLEWRTESMSAGSAAPPVARAGWPGWATWTLVGFGAAAATTVAIVATGALEARQNEPRFVGGGVRTQSR
jgi:hypothetical protein